MAEAVRYSEFAARGPGNARTIYRADGDGSLIRSIVLLAWTRSWRGRDPAPQRRLVRCGPRQARRAAGEVPMDARSARSLLQRIAPPAPEPARRARSPRRPWTRPVSPSSPPATARCASRITAGPSGAPGGFTVSWMTAAEPRRQRRRLARRRQRRGRPAPASPAWRPSNTWGEGERSFRARAQRVPRHRDRRPDRRDRRLGRQRRGARRTAWSTSSASYANAARRAAASASSATLGRRTHVPGPQLHLHAGLLEDPPGGLAGRRASRSARSTTPRPSSLQILIGWSVQGNGLVSLAHQLIAAKLNVADGAEPAAAADAIAAADAADRRRSSCRRSAAAA